MDWNIIFEYIVSILGILMSVGYYPQAYTIWKKKSSKNVSIISYVIFVLGTSTWTLYGIYLNNWTIFWSFIFGVVGSWLTLILIIIYRKK